MLINLKTEVDEDKQENGDSQVQVKLHNQSNEWKLRTGVRSQLQTKRTLEWVLGVE